MTDNRMTESLESGTLTTEQVKEAIERHSSWVVGTINCFYFNDGTYEAIADELNATISGESASDLVDRARDMARDIQRNLGRNLYSQKDAGTLQETSAMLMELANELDNTRFQLNMARDDMDRFIGNMNEMIDEEVREEVREAIADEPNAKIGGTCELIYDDEGILSCSRCGRHVDMIISGEDNFCSGCGRLIQKAAKR